MSVTGRRNAGLDLLRVVAVCGVVVIHAFRPLTVSRGTEGWQIAAAFDLAFVWAVPVFVMISGALVLAPGQHGDGPRAFYRRRFARIIPACVAWHLIYVLVVRQFIEVSPMGWSEFVRLFLDGQVYGALWFFWVIIGLYLIAPVLHPFVIASDRGSAWLGWTGLVFAAGVTSVSALGRAIDHPLPQSATLATHWWPFVGLFVLGWAYRTPLAGPGAALQAAVLAGGAVVLLGEVIWQVIEGDAERLIAVVSPIAYSGLFVMLAAVCIYRAGLWLGNRLMPEGSTPQLAGLAESAFGVFLCHQLVLALLTRFVVAPTTWVNALSLAVATIPLAFATSLAARRIPGVRVIF